MGYVDLRLLLYPVGSTYISYTSTSPANLFGGTWTHLFNFQSGTDILYVFTRTA